MSSSSCITLNVKPSSSQEQLSDPKIPQLKGIFLADFDPHIGPVIVYQTPSDLISRTRFDSFSAFVIPKREVLNQLVKINFEDIKVMGYPVCLEHGKYFRNAYFFNLCLVVENVSHADCAYEPLVRKLAHYLISLESEIELLSNRKAHEDDLHKLIDGIFNGLNEKGECRLTITNETTVHLKLCVLNRSSVVHSDGSAVHPYHVPIFSRQPPIHALPAEMAKLDLISQKVCPLIDGRRTVGEIACRVLIDVELVARCCANLRAQQVIAVVPVIRYSDVYVCTASMHNYYTQPDIQTKCQTYVALRSIDDKAPLPHVSDVFRLYCSLHHGCTLDQWCLRQSPREHGVHERRLVEFGLLQGWVRRVVRYPVYVGREYEHMTPKERKSAAFELSCDGTHSIEALAYRFNIHPTQLLSKLCADEKYVIIHK